ncbi:MAG: hypothetical protein ACI8VW_003979, partial [bacterium]
VVLRCRKALSLSSSNANQKMLTDEKPRVS